MPNVYHPREIIPELPVIVAATAEELSVPENYFGMSDKEKEIARLQLFTKKGKYYLGDEKKASTKVMGLSSASIIMFGKPYSMVPNSIMQNEEMFRVQKEKANEYLSKVLEVPVKEEKTKTYLEKMVNEVYELILKSSPKEGEIIHLGTMERELVTPDCGRNRLTAEFCQLLLDRLKKKIIENKQNWKIESDRVFGNKHRMLRAESCGIDRLALLPLMHYQSRDMEEKITAEEKLIIVDDHIQTGSSLLVAASAAITQKANVLGITCVSVHKNSQILTIQPEVIEFIASLLPQGEKDLPELNRVLKHVELSIETLTNVEGMILGAILCDPKDQQLRAKFQELLKKFDISSKINYELFQNQNNSLMEEFAKPKVDFKDFEKKLKESSEKRFTVPCIQQVVVADAEGQRIRKEIDARAKLPWILFDFDDTLHSLENYTFSAFQEIIKKYSDVEISIDVIKEKRQLLKEAGQYQYQGMLLDFIKECKPTAQVTLEEMTKEYEALKVLEPFAPKITKEDFLTLRSKYRIGIISDGSLFAMKVPKMKEYYGVDIDGYIYNENGVAKKPDLAMYHQFCKNYGVKEKPIAYVGNSKELDGKMAENAKLKFIKVDPTKRMINIEDLNKELSKLEKQRYHWELLRKQFVKEKQTGSKEPIRKMTL